MVAGTRFETALLDCGSDLSDHQLRWVVFTYCQRFDDWYEQLEDTFAYLYAVLIELDESVVELLPEIRSEVEFAIGEYYESLNEVATALSRLLDADPLSLPDTLKCIGHAWKAVSLNDVDFEEEEDRELCALLETARKQVG